MHVCTKITKLLFLLILWIMYLIRRFLENGKPIDLQTVLDMLRYCGLDRVGA